MNMLTKSFFKLIEKICRYFEQHIRIHTLLNRSDLDDGFFRTGFFI